MIKNMNDNVIQFVGTRCDRDGYTNDYFVDANYIVSDKAEIVKDEYGYDTAVDFDQSTILVKQ